MNNKILQFLGILIIFGMIIFIPNISKAANKEIVLVIDPGHGGRDTGAINTRVGLYEKDINLKIARYLNEYLNEYAGIKIIMTHNGLAEDEKLELVDRGMVARNNNADMEISLHINSASTDTLYGAEVFVTANTSCKKYNEESTKLANNILTELGKLGIYNRGVKTKLSDEPGDKYMYSDGTIADYYGMIRYPMKGEGDGIGVDIANGEGIPGIIVEHCFINSGDIKYINSNENIKKLAKADCDGIVKYYGLKKKSEVIEEKNEETKEPEKPVIKAKLNEKDLIITVTPDVTLKDMVEELKVSDYLAKNLLDENIKEETLVGTGYKFNDIKNKKNYTIIKLGDANGDGELDAIDLLLIKRSILGKYELNENNAISLDLNKDGSVDAIDLLLQKRHLLKTCVIDLQ